MKVATTVALALSLALAGCSHHVRFMSEPEGADVYVDNIYVGQTPTVWQSRSGLPDTAYVRLEKEGYEPLRNAMIDKTYRADVHLLWLIPGIIPYFVATARYEDDYVFRLKPLPGTQAEAEATTGAAPARRETGSRPASHPRREEALPEQRGTEPTDDWRGTEPQPTDEGRVIQPRPMDEDALPRDEPSYPPE